MTIRVPVIPFVLSLLLAACTSPQPTGTVGFSSDCDGDAELYPINADGSGLVHLAHDQAEDWQRTNSPVSESSVRERQKGQDRGDYGGPLRCRP